MKKILLIGIILVFLVGCTPSVTITDFESCIAAGNPAMESYPRKCAANGQTFVEVISEPVVMEKPEVQEDYRAVKYEEDDQMKRILCVEDSDCSFDKLKGSYSELNLPSCSAQLACKGGICVYSC